MGGAGEALLNMSRPGGLGLIPGVFAAASVSRDELSTVHDRHQKPDTPWERDPHLQADPAAATHTASQGESNCSELHLISQGNQVTYEGRVCLEAALTLEEQRSFSNSCVKPVAAGSILWPVRPPNACPSQLLQAQPPRHPASGAWPLCSAA